VKNVGIWLFSLWNYKSLLWSFPDQQLPAALRVYWPRALFVFLKGTLFVEQWCDVTHLYKAGIRTCSFTGTMKTQARPDIAVSCGGKCRSGKYWWTQWGVGYCSHLYSLLYIYILNISVNMPPINTQHWTSHVELSSQRCWIPMKRVSCRLSFNWRRSHRVMHTAKQVRQVSQLVQRASWKKLEEGLTQHNIIYENSSKGRWLFVCYWVATVAQLQCLVTYFCRRKRIRVRRVATQLEVVVSPFGFIGSDSHREVRRRKNINEKTAVRRLCKSHGANNRAV